MFMLRHKQVSAQKLAQMFNISLRTIYRDVETIDHAGIPLFSTPDLMMVMGLLISTE
jgi:predicted DNA-binding transcriptional regulator YafY